MKIQEKKNYNTDVHINKNDYFSEDACLQKEKTQKKSHSINEIKIELVDQKNKDVILTENKNINGAISLNLTDNIKKTNIKEESKLKINNSLGVFINVKDAFPYVGFVDYYFPFLVSKKKINNNSKITLPKILKYFAKEILEKLDLFYYLKLVRTVEILKNILLRNKVEKEELKFLLKYLYYVRDSDFESVVQIIDKKSN